jgi:hypothetical protein
MQQAPGLPFTGTGEWPGRHGAVSGRFSGVREPMDFLDQEHWGGGAGAGSGPPAQPVPPR